MMVLGLIVSTVQERVAGVGSVLVAWSVAFNPQDVCALSEACV